jgi:lipoprotein
MSRAEEGKNTIMNLRMLKGSVAVLASIAIACGAAGCSGKPSKDAVKAGIIKMMKEQGENSYDDNALNDYVGCLVDGSYDKVSADTLQKLADGKTDTSASTGVADGDSKAIGEATQECLAKLTGKES